MFLKPNDRDAFVDWPKIKFTDFIEKYPYSWVEKYVECPLCFGHGGWNLKINAYPLHEKENTPENRHYFSHFRCCCSQCNGYGYVSPDQTNHIHKWIRKEKIANCLHIYECEICKITQEIDSSG